MANILAELLMVYVRARNLGRVYIEILFRIDAKRDLKRRPDLAFVSAARWPIRKRLPTGESWDIIPDLAVEVVSDSSTAKEVLRKIEDYFEGGVMAVWVIYSGVRKIYVYSGPGRIDVVSESEDLYGGDVMPGFRASVKEIFGDESAEQEEIAPEQAPQP